jgi:hypothetical protein
LPPTVRTRAQKAREETQASIEEIPDDEDPAFIREDTPRIIITPSQQPKESQVPESSTTERTIEEPEHPFRNARDAAYAPPSARNVGMAPKPPVNKGKEPAYRTMPPIHDPSIAADLYKRSMDAPITITQRELLSISPELRTQVRDSTTTRRIPTATTGNTQATFHVATTDDEEEYQTALAFSLAQREGRVPPPGALVVADPIEAYYDSLEPGEILDTDRLTVAKESTAIRSVHALVDSSQKKECTVDPGCQVVAMSESTCHSLGLAYDPKIRLHMESANGTFDWSLGLARNVTFLIGTITLYLQVHIIRSPSYEILLGRPFDVLTESVIRNFNNEDQTITISDPNTDSQCTVPTFARGTRSAKAMRTQDF